MRWLGIMWDNKARVWRVNLFGLIFLATLVEVPIAVVGKLLLAHFGIVLN